MHCVKCSSVMPSIGFDRFTRRHLVGDQRLLPKQPFASALITSFICGSLLRERFQWKPAPNGRSEAPHYPVLNNEKFNK